MVTVLTGTGVLMSTFLTWFLKEASVKGFLMYTCILHLDHITGPTYLILCFL